MATHHFEPTVYHVAIGAHEPVLHIDSGDTVVTTTVDAGGVDAAGEAVTEGGNPQTGPFYINDAAPGDTLAVHFDRLVPNRKMGRTSTVIAPHVPRRAVCCVRSAGERPRRLGNRSGQMDSDPRFTGNEASVDSHCRWEPMAGCFGVAPPRKQAISTATSSTHGGNMDYRGFAKGLPFTSPFLWMARCFTSGMDTRYRRW